MLHRTLFIPKDTTYPNNQLFTTEKGTLFRSVPKLALPLRCLSLSSKNTLVRYLGGKRYKKTVVEIHGREKGKNIHEKCEFQ